MYNNMQYWKAKETQNITILVHVYSPSQIYTVQTYLVATAYKGLQSNTLYCTIDNLCSITTNYEM